VSPVPDLRKIAPPAEWGVTIDAAAVESLADRWADQQMPLPDFDYDGTPSQRPESWWFDYVTLAVSVLACLWPPDGDDVWHVHHQGRWVDDAPAVFAVFTRRLDRRGIDLDYFAELSDADGERFFAGRGELQLVPQRVEILRRVAATIEQRWDGSIANLVEAADRDAKRIADLLSETVPGYQDRPLTAEGELRFDKLSHLAAAIMAAGVGWHDGGFGGFEDFPVYPDYMVPRVLRHHGVLVYAPELAATVDGQVEIPEGADAEHGIRWATVFAGAELERALRARGNAVLPPALDYRLWSDAVLGPDADGFGEHHRTITMRY